MVTKDTKATFGPRRKLLNLHIFYFFKKENIPYMGIPLLIWGR
jgi:hypothetical protein